MIQELLGSGGSAPNTGVIGERKLSIPFHSPSPSPACPAPTTPIFTASGAASSTTNTGGVNSSNSSSGGNTNGNSETTTQQNLRCPRCDSTNTKFCYYNNYNLTQPRHFCKTCRRYWTKGGTLRNVPIGGGCRKNKTTIGSGSSNTSGMPMSKPSSNAMAKAKATLSTEMLLNASPGFLGPGLLDHFHPLSHPELQPGSNLTPALWPSIPQGQSSHILALIRGATQFINPNPSPSQVSSVFAPIKTEGNTTLGLEPYGSGAPSILGSFLRGNQHQVNGFGLGVPDGVPNGGNNGANILELYQRLKSSSNYNNCGNENPGSMVLGNVMGSSPSSLAMNSSILEASSGATAENLGGYGMMSSPGISSWSDFPTVPINGAFP